MEIKKKKRMKLKLKMLKDTLAHHPFYLKGLQGAKLKSYEVGFKCFLFLLFLLYKN